MQEGGYLIVGLGNPGTQYEKTRHNLGFLVVGAFAHKHGLKLKRGWRLNGRIASQLIGDRRVHLLLPSTYMNLSGGAVRKAVNNYKIALNRLLVVVDDVYLKLGEMRIRPSGSPGGHNGLKSIDATLGTQEYGRLRIGIGSDERKAVDGREMPLEKYVLGRFSTGEWQRLPQVIDHGVKVIERWLEQDIEAASQLAGEITKV